MVAAAIAKLPHGGDRGNQHTGGKSAIAPLPTQRQAAEMLNIGVDTFIEVGNALAEIRDSRIYRNSFGTFEDYCKERWGFTRMQASRVIAAAEVVGNVTDRLQDPPSNIEQTRPLTKLPAEQQPEAWAKAQELPLARAREDQA